MNHRNSCLLNVKFKTIMLQRDKNYAKTFNTNNRAGKSRRLLQYYKLFTNNRSTPHHLKITNHAKQKSIIVLATS